MDAHIRKVYVPMTETGFYILLCLREECHGYGIVQRVEALTDGEIRLSPGNHVRKPLQNGEGWADLLCAGGGKAEDLPHYRAGQPGFGIGNEANRTVIPEHDGGAGP